MYSSTDHLSSIPFELFKKIFSYLTFKDKLICYEVSESWSQLIDKLNNECLIVKEEYVHDFYFDTWFDDQFKGIYKFISPQNQILTKDVDYNFLRSAIRSLVNNPPKQLIIHSVGQEMIRIIFAVFNQIEKLSIRSPLYDDKLNFVVIELPNLRILSIQNTSLNGILIISSNLQYLYLKNCSITGGFEFKFPQSIEYLKTDHYYYFIQKLTNLKVLYCKELFTIDGLLRKHNFDLLNKPKLEIIHTTEKKSYDELQNQKIKYNLDQLKIYLDGLNMNINEISELTLNSETLQNQKYINKRLIEYSLFEEEINYSIIRKIYSRYNSFDWVTKCPNLNQINFDECVQDEDQLINFFDEVKSINFLKFEISFISSNLLRRLFDIRPLLTAINLVCSSNNKIYTEDQMRIVFQFTNLTCLWIDQVLSTEFVAESYSKLHRLIDFCFKSSKNDGKIRLIKTKVDCIHVYTEFPPIRCSMPLKPELVFLLLTKIF